MTQYEIGQAVGVLLGVLVYSLGWLWAWRSKEPLLGIAFSIMAAGQFVGAAMVPLYGYAAGNLWAWTFNGLAFAFVLACIIYYRTVAWWHLRKAAALRAEIQQIEAELADWAVRDRKPS